MSTTVEDFTQNLFWNNLLSKKHKKKMENFDHLTVGTFLRDFEHPYFIFTGTNRFKLPKFLENQKLISKLKKQEVHFFLYEPVSFFLKHENNFSLGFYSEFHHTHANFDAEELHYINNLGEKLNKPIKLNHCDYKLGTLLGDNYPYINFLCRDIFLRQSCHRYIPNLDYYMNIKKPFWCSNGRYTIHRHLIMCYLADKPGNYSWHFQAVTKWTKTVDWLQDNLPLEYLKRNNKILNYNSFSLDFDAEKTPVRENSNFEIPNGPVNIKNIKYFKTMLDCFVCIVNETRFAQPTANVSEKVIEAINLRKPFIIVGPPHCLEYLRKLGFQTFLDFWDESYDQEENHSKRLEKIFNLIDCINKKSIDELNKLYKELIPKLDYNREVVKNLKYDGAITID